MYIPVTYQLQVEEARINDSETHWQRTRSDAGLAARGTDSTLRRASSAVRLLPTSVAAAGRALSSLAAPGVGARRRLGSIPCQTARRRSCQCFLLPVTATRPGASSGGPGAAGGRRLTARWDHGRSANNGTFNLKLKLGGPGRSLDLNLRAGLGRHRDCHGHGHFGPRAL